MSKSGDVKVRRKRRLNRIYFVAVRQQIHPQTACGHFYSTNVYFYSVNVHYYSIKPVLYSAKLIFYGQKNSHADISMGVINYKAISVKINLFS